MVEANSAPPSVAVAPSVALSEEIVFAGDNLVNGDWGADGDAEMVDAEADDVAAPATILAVVDNPAVDAVETPLPLGDGAVAAGAEPMNAADGGPVSMVLYDALCIRVMHMETELQNLSRQLIAIRTLAETTASALPASSAAVPASSGNACHSASSFAGAASSSAAAASGVTLPAPVHAPVPAVVLTPNPNADVTGNQSLVRVVVPVWRPWNIYGENSGWCTHCQNDYKRDDCESMDMNFWEQLMKKVFVDWAPGQPLLFMYQSWSCAADNVGSSLWTTLPRTWFGSAVFSNCARPLLWQPAMDNNNCMFMFHGSKHPNKYVTIGCIKCQRVETILYMDANCETRVRNLLQIW